MVYPGFLSVGFNELNCPHFIFTPNIFEGSPEDMSGELPSENHWLV